jgi:hypothetical protein
MVQIYLIQLISYYFDRIRAGFEDQGPVSYIPVRRNIPDQIYPKLPLLLHHMPSHRRRAGIWALCQFFLAFLLPEWASCFNYKNGTELSLTLPFFSPKSKTKSKLSAQSPQRKAITPPHLPTPNSHLSVNTSLIQPTHPIIQHGSVHPFPPPLVLQTHF